MSVCSSLFELTGSVLFCSASEQTNILPFTWDPAYVLLSVGICIVYSGIACDMYGRSLGDSQTYHLSLLKTGFIYGLGIFSMHFVGMYALTAPGPFVYDFFITAFSLLVAISGTSLVLMLMYQRQSTLAVSLVLGLTIVMMHYSGMLSVLANPYHMHHRVELLVLAVIYVVIGSYLSLRLFQRYLGKLSNKALVLTSVCMGLTISGMHYIAMLAMEFTPMAVALELPHRFYLNRELIIGFTILMLLVTVIIYIHDSIRAEKRLNVKRRELEVSNKSISSALTKLKAMQEQLVESEKMASMGQLVSGVAHEINTPVGICLTSASHLQEEGKSLFDKFDNKTMARTDFEAYIDLHRSATELILEQLRKASELIQSFKQVSVDQNSETCRLFYLAAYVGEVAKSLNYRLEESGSDVELICEQDFEVNSYPSAISLILTHLIMNSVVHGFANKKDGLISIRVSKDEVAAKIEYEDNGCGMNAEDVEKIYTPFFTTKRSEGFRGLGMQVVYNQAVQKLKGSVECHSAPEQGVKFLICFPLDSECEMSVQLFDNASETEGRVEQPSHTEPNSNPPDTLH